MRRIAYIICGMLLTPAGLGADSPGQHDDTMELVGIEGTWRLTRVEVNGHKVDAPFRIIDIYWRGQFSFIYSDGDKIQGNYRIDITCKPPHLDLVPSNGLRKGQTLGRIYQIDGNTLRVAVRIGDGRQQGFNEEGIEVWTYKRM